MAKKNLASLMNGIMGDKPVETIETVQETEVSEVTDTMRENLEAKRRQNVGRPRKDASGYKAEETRATFIVDPELIRKVKFISLVESTLLKDVISDALTTYIEAWESENGKICLPKKK